MRKLSFTPTPDMLGDPDFSIWLAGNQPSLKDDTPLYTRTRAEIDHSIERSATNLITVAGRIVDIDVHAIRHGHPLSFFAGTLSLASTTALLSRDSLTYSDEAWVPNVGYEDLTVRFLRPAKLTIDHKPEHPWVTIEDAREGTRFENTTIDVPLIVYNGRGRYLLSQIQAAVSASNRKAFRKAFRSK